LPHIDNQINATSLRDDNVIGSDPDRRHGLAVDGHTPRIMAFEFKTKYLRIGGIDQA